MQGVSKRSDDLLGMLLRLLGCYCTCTTNSWTSTLAAELRSTKPSFGDEVSDALPSVGGVVAHGLTVAKKLWEHLRPADA